MASSGLATGTMMQLGECFDDLLGDILHDVVVHLQQVVAAHAGLARHPGRDHDDVRVGAVFEAIAADQAGVGSLDRTGLQDVERHALGLRLGDVDHHHVGQFPVRDCARHGGPDVARSADDGDFPVHARTSACMFSMIASANSEVFSSVAPSICRARS